MTSKYKCDGCDEIYDTYTEAFDCHLPLDYEPEYWEQMMIEDDRIQKELDCS